MDIQELVVKSIDEKTWKVVGLIGLNEQIIFDSSMAKIPASKNTIIIVKELLLKGKEIFISKSITRSEVLPNDLVIKETDDLQCFKNLALQEINNAMQYNVYGVSVLECFDYLTCYMKMLANGIFITDENREDKYFEIIEAAQTCEMPDDLKNDASFEEEQEYFKKKQAYDTAQSNLKNLEQFLNAYDKLSKINYVHNKLSKVKTAISNSSSIDEVKQHIQDFYAAEQTSTNSSIQ